MKAPSAPPRELPSTGLIPVTAWNDYHPWPPIGGLRHLIFHAATNGFDVVVRRCGRRVLIDEHAFFDWVEQQTTAARAALTRQRGKAGVK